MSALAGLRWHWTVESFEQAVAAGVFGPEARIELFEGEVLALGAMLPGHAQAVRVLSERAFHLDKTRWAVGSQVPVVLGDSSEPEPDLWIARGPLASFARRHPDETDLVLVIEVSDTSLAIDRDVKVPGYAAAGVVEVWLVSLPERQVIIYQEPVPGERRFASAQRLEPADTATHPSTGLSVPLGEVFAGA